MIILGKSLFFLIVAVSFVACGSKKTSRVSDVPNNEQKNVQQEQSLANLETTKTKDQNLSNKSTSGLPKVFFDFDRFDIKSSQKESIDAIKEHVKDKKINALIISGHADSRGTIEYNMALSKKRAESVKSAVCKESKKKYRGLNDLSYNKCKVRAFGFSKPAAEGNDETAYSQNRRVEVDVE